jgi:hypothetical protein
LRAGATARATRPEINMVFPEKLPDAPQPSFEDDMDGQSLRQQAVAIDPQPSGAIGIEKLLGRFERFAEARAMTDLPKKSPIGVRELLTRLGNLADAGYFAPTGNDDPDQK